MKHFPSIYESVFKNAGISKRNELSRRIQRVYGNANKLPNFCKHA